VAAIRDAGADGVARYLDRYVYGPATHAGYLALFPEARRAEAARRARELV
jgi:hypothetical protein